MIGEVWRYRSFVLTMVRREFAVRYLRSGLGSLWAVAPPAAMVVIYTVVFGHLMQARLPGLDDALAYGIFACAGVASWGAFAEVVTRCQTVFPEHANLLKKINFPHATLPVIVVLTATLNFVVVVAIFVVAMTLLGRFPGWALLGCVPLFLLQQGLALGIGVTLGAVNVFVRDVGHVVAVGLQVWFWCTPIVYPAVILAETPRRLLALNPLTGIVTAYQEIMLTGTWPDWASLWPQAVVVGLALGIGMLTFRRLSPEMADYL